MTLTSQTLNLWASRIPTVWPLLVFVQQVCLPFVPTMSTWLRRISWKLWGRWQTLRSWSPNWTTSLYKTMFFFFVRSINVRGFRSVNSILSVDITLIIFFSYCNSFFVNIWKHSDVQFPLLPSSDFSCSVNALFTPIW